MLFIDVEYARRLGVQLRNFKDKGRNLYNFSCPLCGDSKKNKRKARAYFYEKKGGLFFKCHNCGRGTTLSKLISQVDSALGEEYKVEKFRQGSHNNNPVEKPAESVQQAELAKKVEDNYIGLKSVHQLTNDHIAWNFCEKRLIPYPPRKDLYFAPRFKTWVQTKSDNPRYSELQDDARLVIPFYDANGRLIACQGRSLMKSTIRYLTVKFVEDAPKVYGLDRWEPQRRTYVVEGPLDSLFIDNCLAVAGADLTEFSLLNKKLTTLVFDNEPRNPITVKKISSAIDRGYAVFIPPEHFSGKDINEAILNGHRGIQSIIDGNTFEGAIASLKLSQWKK